MQNQFPFRDHHASLEVSTDMIIENEKQIYMYVTPFGCKIKIKPKKHINAVSTFKV